MKRIKAILLSGFSLALIGSGCSSKEESTQPPAATTSGMPTASGSPAASAAAVKPKLDLSIFIDGPANSNLPSDPNKDFVRKTIEEKFNVNLKVNYMVLGTDYNNKINALLASGDAPDMWRDGNSDGGLKYALDGLLADMTSFVSPQTMPNYYKYWISEDEMKRYRINNSFVRAPLPFDRKPLKAYYIRKDWLDKLGLKIPTTYDEYIKVLQAFRNNDPDGNGKKDTYGYTTAGGGNSPSLDWPEWIKNGLTSSLFVENNKFVDMQSDLRFEQVANDIVKVINQDLVDPDWFLNTGPQSIDKAASGKVGVIIGGGKDFAFDSNPQSLQTRSKAIFPQADWQPFVPFQNTPLITETSAGAPFLFPKTGEKNAEKTKRIVEILDWLAGPEGFLLTHYGIEGKHYKKNGNNIELIRDAINEDITKQGDFLQIWDFFSPYKPDMFGLTVIDPRETDRDRAIYKTLLSIPVRPGIGTNVVPPPGFDLSAFRNKMREFQVKIILEEKSGANYPKYYQELMTTYGGDKMFKAYEEQIRAAGTLK